jgi:multidrug resistance efflux pump
VVPGARGAPDAGVQDFAAALSSFLRELLERQCRMTGAVVGVIYVSGSGVRPSSIGATYVAPDDRRTGRVALDQALMARLTKNGAETSTLPARARHELATLVQGEGATMYHAEPTHRVLAAPLVAAEQVHGASVLVVPLSVRQSPEDALERVSLSGASYEAFLWRNHCMTEAQTKARLRETLELLDAAQQAERAEAMGAIFCHELQRRFGCTRVSVGLLRGGRLRVVGVSGADDLNKHAAVVESLEALMEECADQDIEVVYPPPPEDEADPARRRVTRSHALHSSKFGPASLLSLPLRVSGDLVGVATLEREAADPFPVGAVPLLRLVAEFIGPALWTRRMADRGVVAVTRDRAAEVGAQVLGPRFTGVKAIVALVVLVLALAAFVPIPGRVTAEAEVRALVSRTIPPPYEGFLDEVRVKPGDAVRKGDVLATMDLKETLLQVEQTQMRLRKLQTQQDDARTRGQQGDAAVLAAAVEEVQGEIELLRDRVARGAITAPIAGAISRGDIEPLAGAKVEPSQPLFEIIEPETQVIVLRVKERDIGGVAAGQEGRMALTGLPDTKVPVRVVRVRPAAEAVQKDNIFYVEAEIIEDRVEARHKPIHAWLKPGMTGTARLEHGTSTVLWEVVRPLADAVRLRLWW